MTGEILKPTQKKDEDEEKFVDRLETLDGKNHQILTWFRNTYANVIKLDLCRFDTAKEVWDFLASRYSISDYIHQFQLYSRLHRAQQPGQSVNSYVSELQNLWDQLANCDPAWPNTEVAKIYADLRDHQCVWHLLMTLRDEFEPI